MVDINARINWVPGMELTAETFSGIGEDWYQASPSTVMASS